MSAGPAQARTRMKIFERMRAKKTPNDAPPTPIGLRAVTVPLAGRGASIASDSRQPTEDDDSVDRFRFSRDRSASRPSKDIDCRSSAGSSPRASVAARPQARPVCVFMTAPVDGGEVLANRYKAVWGIATGSCQATGDDEDTKDTGDADGSSPDGHPCEPRHSARLHATERASRVPSHSRRCCHSHSRLAAVLGLRPTEGCDCSSDDELVDIGRIRCPFRRTDRSASRPNEETDCGSSETDCGSSGSSEEFDPLRDVLGNRFKAVHGIEPPSLERAEGGLSAAALLVD